MINILRKVYIFLLLLCVQVVTAQEISVASFRSLENDLTANTYATMVKDRNGEVSALIKVVTPEKGFVFDGGMAGIVKTVQEAGEIWVYVPHGIKRLSIRHPKFGVLRDFYFPEAIEKARTYELKLKINTPTQNHIQDTRSSLLKFTYQPSNAKIYIDNVSCNPISEGLVSFMLSYGIHTYRVEAEGYIAEEQTFTVDEEQEERTVALRKQTAKLTLQSSVAEGEIFLNGEQVGVGEWTGELDARDYVAEVRKQGYASRPDSFSLFMGADTVITLLAEMYNASLIVKSPYANGHIYVDGVYKGMNECSVELMAGEHIVELQLMSSGMVTTACQTDTILLVADEERVVEMTDPQTYVGGFSIVSEPSQCEVYSNGAFIGYTPIDISEVPMGNHPVILCKEGYEPKEFDVHIVKDAQTNLTVKLDVAGTFDVVIADTVRSAIGKEPLKVTVNGVDFTMIPVRGGDYKEEQLSSYYIGETEVTCELWNAVLGGKEYPYPYNLAPANGVDWYACQVFINALNCMTGKRFKMPTVNQWEYAAHGGTESKGYIYSGGNNATRVAWYAENADGRVQQVKRKHPNELGLYDMSGNVWEWCSDFIVPDKDTGVKKVIKGGSINKREEALNPDLGIMENASYRGFVGLRLVLEE